jgi:hypothetical protein
MAKLKAVTPEETVINKFNKLPEESVRHSIDQKDKE